MDERELLLAYITSNPKISNPLTLMLLATLYCCWWQEWFVLLIFLKLNITFEELHSGWVTGSESALERTIS